MARAPTTRDTRRVAVGVSQDTPGIAVNAPLTAPVNHASAEGVRDLMRALQVGTAVAEKVNKDMGDEAYAQGKADKALGRVDEERLAKSRRYADGAFEVGTIQTWQSLKEAANEYTSRPEFDKTRPLDEQVADVDAFFKENAGKLVADPRSRKIFADRYQEWINNFATATTSAQMKENVAEATEAVLTDARARYEESGYWNWDETHARLSAATGSNTYATKALVGMVATMTADAAAAGKDDYAKLPDTLVPAKVKSDTGQELPGPRFTPEHRDTLLTASVQAEAAYHKTKREQYAAGEFNETVRFDKMLADGVPITVESFKDLPPVGSPDERLTAAQRAAYIQRSEQLRTAALKKDDDYGMMMAYRGATPGTRWADLHGVNGWSEKDVEDGFYQHLTDTLRGVGLSEASLFGPNLLKDKQVLDTVVKLSAQEGMVYEPLKSALSSIPQVAPGDILSRLEAYEQVKREGIVGLYTDDKTSLLFEGAIAARDAGAKPEDIAATLRTANDPARHEYVASQMKGYKGRETGFAVVTGVNWIGMDKKVSSTRIRNRGYIDNMAEKLTTYALQNGAGWDLSRAQKWAQQRINDTHTALPLGDSFFLVRNTDVGNPTKAADALKWFTEDYTPTVLAKKLKVSADELDVNPEYGLNGRGLLIHLSRGGVPINWEADLPAIIKVYEQQHPELTGRGKAEAANDKAQKNRSAPRTTSLRWQAR